MLAGKRVVITGANGTLGKAVASRAEELGASVVRLDITFGDALPAGARTVDLADLASVRACFAAIGDFDALFNIAGGFTMGATAWDDSDEQWDAMFRINVLTLRNVLKVAVPALRRKGAGSIVNVGAYGALSGQGHMSAYATAKSAVMRLTESLSEEVKGNGINVNAVLPTIIDTPPNRAGMPDADFSRWVAPADLANVICFLGSDAARAVHGALVPVRGLS